MRFPFNGSPSLTQDWGNKLIINGVDVYAQFGLKGHNGTDWGLPTGTVVIAPHDGKVIEAASDPKGYGNYIKIENDIEGSILAHLKSFSVKVGNYVTEGQIIGYSNNTGNSTGPHLHWGYYRKPRNKNNGYSGTVDPFQYIGGSMPNVYKGLDLTNLESMKVAVDVWDEVVNQKLYVKATEYNLLKDTSETRIKAEVDRYETFVEKLVELLGCSKEEPKILEAVSELLTKETNKVEVADPTHSKICRLLAKVGL